MTENEQADLDDFGYQGVLARNATVQKIVGRTGRMTTETYLAYCDEQDFLVVAIVYGRETICRYWTKLDRTHLKLLSGEQHKARDKFIDEHRAVASARFWLACSEWVSAGCVSDYPRLPYLDRATPEEKDRVTLTLLD